MQRAHNGVGPDADWKIWYISVLYAILQFGITGIVYFNPFIGMLPPPAPNSVL